MRPAAFVFLLFVVLGSGFAACFVDAREARIVRAPEVADMRTMASHLGLTDLALFTEARYTRHPSQADLHSAFQDHPLAFEHFPSGSLIVPRHDALVRKTSSSD